ncbi:MAG: glycosyltransferase [Candidatus Lokiarchaeota archaeon]|nr:glycosyltransferase [Candidatus Lokiarchaeota archaeon]
MPSYNRPERIGNIINQIITSQSDEIEIIVSDNNPISNQTQEIVKKINDLRVKYFRNKKNIGFDLNILKVIERASGEFIFLQMDEDDIEIKTIPWILKTIKENKNISQLCGSIGDKKPYKDKSYLKVTKVKPRRFEDIIRERYIANKNYSIGKIRYIFGDKFYKQGEESLKALLFNYPHGSGIVLRKKALDLNSAKIYDGFLFMQQVLIAQALIAGDTLCTSKIFAYFGNVQYETSQPLFEGKKWYHPINKLLQIKFRIQIIYDIITGNKKNRKTSLEQQKQYILENIITLLFTRNTRNFAYLSADFQLKEVFFNLLPLLKSFKDFIKGLSIVLTMKRAKTPGFWTYFIKKIISDILKI